MRILLTGRTGQVGAELVSALAPIGDVLALDRNALDLTDAAAIRRVVREARPGIIVNAAAYTAVDRAESEPELAMAINGAAPGVPAAEALRVNALLVHYSTSSPNTHCNPVTFFHTHRRTARCRPLQRTPRSALR